MSGRYTVYGLSASYFSRKVVGLFTYKAIPFDFRLKTRALRPMVEEKSGTHLIPVVETPAGEWLFDSTPIALEMDRLFPASAVIPPDALGMMTTRILEDFFDEWVTRFAIFFRWQSPENIETAGRSLALESAGLAPGDEDGEPGQALVGQILAAIQSWAAKAAEALGAGIDAKAELEAEWQALCALMSEHFESRAFLGGGRPTLADFALYGGLSAHFLGEPATRERTLAAGPGLEAYRQRMEAARADTMPAWEAAAELPPTLALLLGYVAASFHPFLAANRRALAAGNAHFSLDTAYGARRFATRAYSEKTRIETATALAALPAAQQASLARTLGPLGVLDVYGLTRGGAEIRLRGIIGRWRRCPCRPAGPAFRSGRRPGQYSTRRPGRWHRR